MGTNSANYTDNTMVTGDLITVTLAFNSPCAVPAPITASGPPITVWPLPVLTSSTYTTNTLKGGDLISVGTTNLGPCASPASLTSASVRIREPVGINRMSGDSSGWQESLLLHPNPNSGQFTVSTDWGAVAAGEKVWVEVVNALGQVVFREAVQPAAGRWNLDIQLQERLSNGVYQLRVVREREGVVVRPVLLQR